MHGRVSAVIHTGVQGVCGKSGLQQGPQHCGVATGRGQVDGRAALKVSAQHKRVVVQQGSQAVLAASHCLQGTQEKGVRSHSFSGGEWLGGQPRSTNYFQESILSSTVILVLGSAATFLTGRMARVS